ncbi:peptidylprolyl isomerase [Helicobacter felis]|uniref:peptidylprolyl isomerase n=1 Tax=Helicobacter felis TaxID=214 RepID=UPI000CEF0F9A|nr:peptidylprolyl isomerase [Helicobacter felis]
MIAWMQKHKKYLVVTIWISTIAFIAAGMIGWGQYNFSMASGSVAKVGRVLISSEELEMERKRLVDAYSQSIPNFKDLDEKQIAAMGLEKTALRMLINQAYLKNLALDLGLGVSDAEIATEIQKSALFQKDGHFDVDLYKKVLQDNHYRPALFEENVKNALILQKVSGLFPSATTPLEKEAFTYPLKIQDHISIKILEASHAPIQLEESALKAYYDQHKNTYKKPTRYTLQTLWIKPKTATLDQSALRKYYQDRKSNYTDAQGKLETFEQAKDRVIHDYNQAQAKENALKQYLALKKGNLNPKKESFTDLPYGTDIDTKIIAMQPGEVLKPLEYKEGYLVVKLVEKSSGLLKSFQEAKSEVMATLQAEAQQKWLKQEVQKQVKNFQGNDIGILSPEFYGTIQGLDVKDSRSLVDHIFKHPSKEGFVVFKDKAVLYKVSQQDFQHKLGNESYLKDMATNLKAQDFDRVLVAMLKNKYPITIYVKSLQE